MYIINSREFNRINNKYIYMNILAVDVGVGTQDIMFYDTDYPIENSIKMVMPSPTKILAKRIRKHHNDILINGNTMGGGPVNKAIENHIKRGYKVLMTENAARTVRDDLKRVKSLGIEIVSEREHHPELGRVELKDIDLDSIKESLSKFEVKLDFDCIGIAIQDHGYLEGVGDRNFRFMKIKEKLNVPRYPEEFAYYDMVPEYFTRMNGVLNTLKGYKPIIMDSKFASICGATCDPIVKELNSYIAIDIGNGHTLAAAFDNGKIIGVFEHHTKSLDPEKIKYLIEKLIDGTITHNEVHDDGGHGAWTTAPMDNIECVVATGPMRGILQKTGMKVHYAAPAGDVMMAGPVGLIKAIMSRHTD
ncbi:DUF1786 domain-containing protein [Methanobacterium spitsbergense]|nr:DUF1786 domain-containing protein [Methanobacterium spitsbergense]